MASCSEAVTSDFLACLASLAENKFKLPNYPGHDGEVTSINEVAKPEIFSVFRVLSGSNDLLNRSTNLHQTFAWAGKNLVK
jgi:hypothetical protein